MVKYSLLTKNKNGRTFMNCDMKSVTKRSVQFSLLAYFVYFLIFYLSQYIFYDSVALAYLWLFIKRISYFIFPIVSAEVALICYGESKKRAFTTLIFITLPRMIHTLPSFYLMLIAEHFDSVESISFGALLSIAEAIVYYGIVLIFLFIMLFIIKKRSGDLCALLNVKTTFDFSSPLALSFMIVSLIPFLYLFISEIVSTVAFIASYGTYFTFGELAFTVFSYLYAIAAPFICYFTISGIKNKIFKS